MLADRQKRLYSRLLLALPFCVLASLVGTGAVWVISLGFGIRSDEILWVFFSCFLAGPLLYLAILPDDDDGGACYVTGNPFPDKRGHYSGSIARSKGFTTDVVVIDDEPTACGDLAGCLRAAGFTVSTAASSDEGLGLIRDLRPRLAFVEINLPGSANGCRLAELATGMDHTAKIILMSADIEAVRGANEGGSHGAFAVLEKPLPLPAVVRFVESILESGGQYEENEKRENKA